MKNMRTARRENAPRPKETNNYTFSNNIGSLEVLTTALVIHAFDSCFMDFHLIVYMFVNSNRNCFSEFGV